MRREDDERKVRFSIHALVERTVSPAAYLLRILEVVPVGASQEHLSVDHPAVVHHGNEEWTAAADQCSLLDADEETLVLVKGHVSQFCFVLDDLSGPTMTRCERAR
jgi:hypothetical protein